MNLSKQLKYKNIFMDYAMYLWKIFGYWLLLQSDASNLVKIVHENKHGNKNSTVKWAKTFFLLKITLTP